MEGIHQVMLRAVWVFGGVAFLMVALVVAYFAVRRAGRMRGF